MTSNSDLFAKLIEQQKQSSKQTKASESIINEDSNEVKEQEYVFWARREELDTAGEVEISSSLKEDQDELSLETSFNNSSDASTINIEDICASKKVLELNIDNNFLDQQRLKEKRETEKLQEKLMNDEYQKAIGYLLCSSKSKSGKQKKKQTMTAYLFFCRRYRSKIVARNPKLTFAQISKLLSHMWRNASEPEKNTYRLKLEQHRTKVNAIVEKNLIEKMKIVKQQKLLDNMNKNEETCDVTQESIFKTL